MELYKSISKIRRIGENQFTLCRNARHNILGQSSKVSGISADNNARLRTCIAIYFCVAPPSELVDRPFILLGAGISRVASRGKRRISFFAAIFLILAFFPIFFSYDL